MLASAVMAFMRWDLLTPPTFIGFANITQALTVDPLVIHALRVTLFFALVSVPANIVLGVALALLLNSGVRGLRFYRTAYYLPSVLSGVAVALLWRWVFSGEYGLANLMLSWVGVDGPNWLADDRWALPALMIMNVWAVGAGMVIYLAGLQGIPSELYEAAEVDGAGWWPRLRYITVPLITPALFFQLITGIIQALQIFTQPLIMTKGGPYDSTLFYVLYLYRNAFEYFQMGYASVLGWILFLCILLLTLLVFKTGRSWVHYEGESRGGR